MLLGLQTWTVRDLFEASPQATIRQARSFDFLELAGTGPELCEDLAKKLGEDAVLVRGAHICSVGARADDVGDIVREYVRAFPALEWVVFFLNPNDISDMSESPQSRQKCYLEYRKTLKEYKDAISRACPAKHFERGTRRAPTVAYHTYCPDFWPLPNGEPSLTLLSEMAEIQLDSYFAGLSAFRLAEWLESISAPPTLPLKIHSLHLTGITTHGMHEVVPDLTLNNTEAISMRAIFRGVRKAKVTRLIVEHEINPSTMSDALLSLKRIRTFFPSS